MRRLEFLPVLAVAAALSPFARADGAPRTFCNPMPIPDMPVGIECWKFNAGDLIPKEKLAPWAWGCWPGPKEGPKYARQFRELADPEIHVWNGAWYLYPSCGLLWKSTDCGGTWQHVKAIEHNRFYAPTMVKFRNRYYLTESYATLKVADSPEGPFAELGKFELKTFLSSEEPTTNFGDPMLFADGDRLYIYLGCVPKEKCLWGTELDPENPRRAKAPARCLLEYDPKTYPWQATNEGAWVFKRGGTYYLIYSGHGTSDPRYCGVAMKSDAPLGPFVHQKNNPFFQTPTGVVTGTGHGSVFEDAAGDLWATYCVVVCRYHHFERLIGRDRIEMDGNGDLIVARATDTPQIGRASCRERV